MRSTFSGFNAPVSGLFAAQRAMDVVGHNLSNIDTDGFTRQRSNQAASFPTYDGRSGWIGTGVRMRFITQIRDELLDARYREKYSKMQYWTETSASLRNMENIFGEPSEKAITDIINNFYGAIDNILKNPTNNTARSQFINTAITFTNYFNDMSEKLNKTIQDLDKDAVAMVTDLNSMLHQVAVLNKQIFIDESDGSMANDLRDKRNLLVDQISKLINVKASKTIIKDNQGRPREHFQLTIDGHVAVLHDDVFEVKIGEKVPTDLYKMARNRKNSTTGADEPSTDAMGLTVTRFEFYDGERLSMNRVGGMLGATLQQRDSVGDPKMNNAVRGVPYYIRALNEYMRTFTDEANRIHKQGFDANGDPGIDLFVSYELDPDSGVPSLINSKNVRVNPIVINSIKKLAIGLENSLDGKPSESDTGNFHRFFKMKETKLSIDFKVAVAGVPHDINLGQGTPEDVIKSLITSILGVDAKEANDTLHNSEVEELELNMLRMSVSGVSENEELTNMLKFQHAYNASARMITTVDEMLDVIINRMGRVGL